MSIYSEIVAGVVAWTNRPEATAEIDLAIRQAVRAAHNSGKFFKDLNTLSVTGLTTSQIQTIDLASSAPLYRRLATVKPTGYDVEYKETDILNLFDNDRFPRTDVYWLVGNTLTIRAAAAVPDITVTYYKNPTTSPISSLDSWIGNEYQDLIICWAAATILNLVGEQEIKVRAEAIAAVGLRDLLANNLTVSN